MRRTWTAVVIAATLGLGACGGGLEDDDPKGYEACEMFDREQDADGKVPVEVNVAIGEIASQATTDGIREAAGDGALTPELRAESDLPQLYFVDVVELRSACAEAGYKF